MQAAKILKEFQIPFFLIEHGSAYVTFGNPLINRLWEYYERHQANILKRYCSGFLCGISGKPRLVESFRNPREGDHPQQYRSAGIRRNSFRLAQIGRNPFGSDSYVCRANLENERNCYFINRSRAD